MRKIKVGIFTFGFYTGGTERQVIELIKGLDRDRFEVNVGAFRPGGQMEFHLTCENIQVNYFPIESMYSTNSLRQLGRLRRFLIRNRIDVMHTFSLMGNTFGTLGGLLARVPIIISSRRDMGVMIPRFYGPLQTSLSRQVDQIVTNADAIKRKMVEKERIDPDKIKVIYNGVDINRFSIDRSIGAEVRRELGISDRAPVIGIIAEIKPVKGHIYLLKAVRRLINSVPDLRLLIIGDSIDPATRVDIEASARELGLKDQAIFLGRTQEIPRLLAAMDISVLPSLSEGVSNTILESMVAGVPVVATNVGGSPEIVLDGKTGLIVPPADSEALADAILRLLDSPELASRLVANARSMVLSRFSNETMVETYEDLYLKLFEERKGLMIEDRRAKIRNRVEEF
jgi:L-malate glycosyltransferase